MLAATGHESDETATIFVYLNNNNNTAAILVVFLDNIGEPRQ